MAIKPRAVLAGILSLFVALAAIDMPAFAADRPNHKAHLVQSSSSNSLDVTAYGNHFAQIEETRQVQLQAGLNRIQLNGIAAQYRQDSLRVIKVTGPGQFTYRSAIYQPANLTIERILAESVGKNITATVGVGSAAKPVTGTLIAVDGSQIVIQEGSNTYITGTSDVALPGLPAGLSSSAALIVEANVSRAGLYDINFLYETGGISWSTQHSLLYNDETAKIENFQTAVSVTNASGASFKGATLWLLSGDVRPDDGEGISTMMAARAPRADKAAVESVGERKVYRIPGQVDLLHGQSRQLPLFTGTDVPVEREYFVPAANAYDYGGGQSGMRPVSVRLKLENSEKSNLGTPLPAGSVKIYQRNSEKRLQLTGTTQVKELAKGEAFELLIGTSSDIKAERVLVSAVDVGPASGTSGNNKPEYQDRTWKVTVHNFKEKRDVDVVVEVAVPAELKDVTPLTRKTATLATKTVTVKAGSNASFSYTLRFRVR